MNRSKTRLMWILVGIMLLVTACGAGANASAPPDPDSVGDSTIGAELFVERHGDAPSCSYCHSVTNDDGGIGPSLMGIANRANTQVDGMGAVAYLHESIVDPNAYISDDSPKSRMYAHFSDVLSDEDIDNLIAYLLTLK
jgi:cytochrome c2